MLSTRATAEPCPPRKWLKTMGMYSLTDLEARSLQSTCFCRAALPSGALGVVSPGLFQLAVAPSVSRLVAASLRSLPPAPCGLESLCSLMLL